MSGVLADRYASQEMRDIWSQENKIILERELWIAILKTQKNLGLQVSDKVISAYEEVKSKVNLTSINSREKVIKHDVKARIDEFNLLAGHESIHIGLTSRDVTENVELLQIKSSLDLIDFKSLAFLHKLGESIESFISIPIVARTHNVPAQVTTLGKRFATWAEELIFAIQHLQQLRNRLALRGIKGAVGTQQDAIDVIGKNVASLDREIAQLLNFNTVSEAVSQIYPRSYDYEVLTSLIQISAAPTNMATTIRLMSGHGLVSESFKEEQVGSSAMPHKVNARSSERVNGLGVVLKGYAAMITQISGNQWNEGDVSCSVVRRVALPDSFYSLDAILDTSINILSNLVINTEAIKSELNETLPFVLSSKILMKAVEQGMGREVAHEAIKAHARNAFAHYQETRVNNFFELVSNDKSLGVSNEFLVDLLINPLQHSGRAQEQCIDIISRVNSLCLGREDILTYLPQEPI